MSTSEYFALKHLGDTLVVVLVQHITALQETELAKEFPSVYHEVPKNVWL